MDAMRKGSSHFPAHLSPKHQSKPRSGWVVAVPEKAPVTTSTASRSAGDVADVTRKTPGVSTARSSHNSEPTPREEQQPMSVYRVRRASHVGVPFCSEGESTCVKRAESLENTTHASRKTK